MRLTLGPCLVLFTKDSRGLVTLLTQDADRQHWPSYCKSLLGDSGILITSHCSATLAKKGLTAMTH